MNEGRNIFKEGIYAGLGMALRTKDIIENFGNRMVKEYNMSEEEGKHFVDDLLRESEETSNRLTNMIQERLNKTLQDMGIAKKDDIDELKERIDELEKKLEKEQNKKKQS